MVAISELASDFCDYVTDGTHDSPKVKEQGKYLITSKHLRRYELDYSSANKISEQDYQKIMQRSSVAQWDILISMIGTIGNIYLETSKTVDYACKNVGIFKMGGNEKKAKWLYYYLQSPKAKEYIIAASRGTTQGYIPLNALRKLPIDVCDKKTRDEIVDILWSLDMKIKQNIDINDNLYAQAKAIFAAHFINIDSIPDGWSQGSLLNIANYLNGLAMQKFRHQKDEVGLPVLKIKELRQGSCDVSSELCSPSIKSEYIIRDGDVIFSWSGSLLVDIWCGGTCGLNQHLFKVTSKVYDKWFYYLWIAHHLDRFIAIAADKATTMGHIKREELAKAEVLIPSESDYQEISSIMKPIFELMISNRIEVRKLAALRDELLPKLMSGEIDVTEVSI